MSATYKIFIGYVEQDKEYLEALRKQLSPLERGNTLDVLYDGLIEPGEEIELEKKQFLRKADIILLLLSSDAIASDDFWSGEIERALERHHKKEARVIPIIIRQCDWTSTPFKRIKCLPSTPKSINDFKIKGNEDAGWMEVINGIKRVLKKYSDDFKFYDEDENLGKEEQKKKNILNNHHKTRCDRVQQNNIFTTTYRKKVKTQKLFFFYFHGGDQQSHDGLFKRFSNYLQGNYMDFSSTFQKSDFEVKSFKVIFPINPSEEHLKTELLSKFMLRLGIPKDKLEEVDKKDLEYVLRNSPELNQLESKDKVCIHISIPENRWNSNVPTIAKWFIKSFCKVDSYPQNGPEFFIFQSIKYKKDRERILAEIKDALKEREFTEILPELESVNDDDIEDWFDEYEEVWDDHDIDIDDLKEEFEEEKEKWLDKNEDSKKMPMKAVEKILKSIIDKLNNKEKNHGNPPKKYY